MSELRGERRKAREAALTMLFECDASGVTTETSIEHFRSGRFADVGDPEPGDDVVRFAETLVRGVSERRDELDALMAAGSHHWRVERMAVVDRNVLRIALFELLAEPDTPAAVILDEAVDLAKYFGGHESGSFVNGVADGIRKRLDDGSLVRE